MMGLPSLAAFLSDESGVVSVDWVVLTGALVGLGLATTNVVSAGMEDMVRDIRVQLETDQIQRSFRNEDENVDVVADDSEWDVIEDGNDVD